MRNRIILGLAAFGMSALCVAAGKLEIHGSAQKSDEPGHFVCHATILDSASGEVLFQKELHAQMGQRAQDVSGTNDETGKPVAEDRFSCSISKDAATADILYVKTTYANGKKDVRDYETQVPVR